MTAGRYTGRPGRLMPLVLPSLAVLFTRHTRSFSEGGMRGWHSRGGTDHLDHGEVDQAVVDHDGVADNEGV